METKGKSSGLWQKTKYANLVRNASSGKYFARFRSNGKLIWRALDTDVLSVAAQRLPDKIKEAKEEQVLLASGSDPRITFEAAAKIYRERVEASPDYKPKTKAYHGQRLDALLKSWPDVKKPLKDITKAECVEWRSGFATKYSPTAFNHTLGILRAIFEIGIEAGARRDNPTKVKEMKRLREAPKHLKLPESDQFEKFVQAIATSGSGHSKPCAELVQFLAYGGFRISEAKHITWGDCNFERRKIIVRGEPGNGLKGRRIGETREVHMIPDMVKLLETMRAERQNELSTAKVMRAGECQKAMDRAAKIVGIARITHHDLRHLFATRCIESDVVIPTVSRWLGHKDGGALAMKTYGHLRDEHSAEMAQKVSFAKPKDIVPLPVNGSAVAGSSETPIKDGRNIAEAKAKYSYPWWVAKNPLEMFWGQLNEPVQIISPERFCECAKQAMNREVFQDEPTDRDSLRAELEVRIGNAALFELKSKIQLKDEQKQLQAS